MKTTVIYSLFLIAMLLCGTAVMKILDLIFILDYENIWSIGFKVGFFSWLVLIVLSVIKRCKKADK